MKKITFIFFLSIIIVVLSSGFAQKGDTMHIGSFSRSVAYAPYLIAKNKGEFEKIAQKHGVKIEYSEFQSLPPITEAFATNKVDIIFEAELPATIGKAAGVDIKIKAPVSNYKSSIVIPQNSKLQNIRDLKGKKVAVLGGTSSHYALSKALVSHGLSIKDVEILDMPPAEAKMAFESGQVDAWAVWPPFVEQEEIAGKGKAWDTGVFIQIGVVARNGFAKEQSAFMADFIKVIQETQKWIAANPKEAQAIMAKELKLDLAIVEKAWTVHNFQPSMAEKEIADIQAKADFLYDLKFIKNKVNVAKDLIDIR